MDLSLLLDFIVEADSKTWIANRNRVLMPGMLRSTEFRYDKENLHYRNICVGSRRFSGMKVVYEDLTAKWCMNYYGGILGESTDSEKVYAILREALLAPKKKECPLRGPEKWSKGEFTYKFRIDGWVEGFSGSEVLYQNGVWVYRLFFQGGIII